MTAPEVPRRVGVGAVGGGHQIAQHAVIWVEFHQPRGQVAHVFHRLTGIEAGVGELLILQHINQARGLRRIKNSIEAGLSGIGSVIGQQGWGQGGGHGVSCPQRVSERMQIDDGVNYQWTGHVCVSTEVLKYNGLSVSEELAVWEAKSVSVRRVFA